MVKKVVVDNEVEELKKQLAEMMARLEGIQKSPQTQEQKEGREIKPDSYVKVMSLISEPLNLSTEPSGRGRNFRFSQFAEVKRILYADLQRIIENNSTFFNDFKFIIMDRDVIVKNGYEDMYEAALTKEKIEMLFDPKANQTDAVNLFKTASEKQRESIVTMILDRAVAGLSMDLNFLRRLSDVVGYDIEAKIKRDKELIALQTQK